VADLGVVLDALGEEPAKLLQTGGLGVREIRRVAKLVRRSEREAAVLLELAGVAGLAGVDRSASIVLPAARYDAWRDEPLAARWAAVVSAWVAAPRDVGLVGRPDPSGRLTPALAVRSADPDAAVRRRLVLEALARLPAGRSPASLSQVVGHVVWGAPLVFAGAPVEPATLEALLEELALLGLGSGAALVEAGRCVARGDLDGARRAVEQHAPALGSEFVVQADLTAVAPGELEGRVRRELELLADVESRGGATVWRFTEASLRRGFDAGRSAEEILSFLEAHASRGLPQALAYLVSDVGRRFGVLRLGAASTYLRSADEALLAELVRAKRLARLGLRQIAPTVLVSEAGPEAVSEALRKAGYLPAEEGSDGALVVRRPAPRRLSGEAAPRRLGGQAAGRGREGSGTEPWAPWRLPAATGPGGLEASAPGDGTPSEDLAALVARLERGDQRVGPRGVAAQGAGPAPRSQQRHGRLAALADELGELEDLDDLGEPEDLDGGEGPADLASLGGPGASPVVARPTAVVRGSEAIAAVLDRAEAENWLVRLSYRNREGREHQRTVLPLAVVDGDVLAAALPAVSPLRVRLDRVQWARVLTETEEEAALA
jgi:hypothetical protein